MNITVMGTGYVGLVTGATLADSGNKVVCLDLIENKITDLNNGISPIFEPGLHDLIKSGLKSKNLRGSIDIENCIRESDLTFICVGTPSNKDGSIDLTYIKSASASIGRALRAKEEAEHTIIVKSTVVPLTTEEIVLPTILKKSGWKREQLGVGMNPEFLREGTAVRDAQKPDRIVMGASDELSLKQMKKLYEVHNCPKQKCMPRTAEFIKYASNSFLATKISFVNEMANLSNEWGIDFEEVAEGMGSDSRISPLFLRAGAGFGGSCFPKDVKALAAAAKNNKAESKILNATLEVNEIQPLNVVRMAEERLGVIKGKRITVLGLAFKPDTDDVRETRSEVVINELIKKGALVIGHDPKGMTNFKELVDIEMAETAIAAIKEADCIILMTEWKEYTELNYETIKEEMSGNVVIDGRRGFNQNRMEETGFDYKAIGLG
jgi:UDPglucose 6-dehydrogenase